MKGGEMEEDPRHAGGPLGSDVPGLRAELLFEMSVDLVDEAQVVGATPHGLRRIRYIKGGTFAGPKLAGEVLPGGADWLLVRSDGAREIDVRVTLRTDDGDLIYAISRGIFDVSPRPSRASSRVKRSIPRSTTSAPRRCSRPRR
jgi:hypothetical protein